MEKRYSVSLSNKISTILKVHVFHVGSLNDRESGNMKKQKQKDAKSIRK